MNKRNTEESAVRPKIEFYCSQLRTIYMELHGILVNIEAQQRYIVPIDEMLDTSKIKHFNNVRFQRLYNICDKINNYLIELEDYNSSVMSEIQEEQVDK